MDAAEALDSNESLAAWCYHLTRQSHACLIPYLDVLEYEHCEHWQLQLGWEVSTNGFEQGQALQPYVSHIGRLQSLIGLEVRLVKAGTKQHSQVWQVQQHLWREPDPRRSNNNLNLGQPVHLHIQFEFRRWRLSIPPLARAQKGT